MILDEVQMIDLIRQSRRVFLLEPPYPRKYLPLGLAKIAAFVKANGGEVLYGRKYAGEPVDMICVASLFTYESGKVIAAVRAAQKLAPHTPILAGGIYASLMPAHLERETGVLVFPGYSKTLDQCVPDYSLGWGMDEKWQGFSFTFTMRGCPNLCGYCAVRRIESEPWVNPTWRDHILGEKPYAMISDNNLSAADPEHLFAVLDELIARKRRVVFDNGFDCKHITDELARRLAQVKFYKSGMRLAFDRIEEDGLFQEAALKLRGAGVPKGALMAYVLFNFQDSPQEADYRMRECLRVGVRPYPQQFTPLSKTSRGETYVSRKWTANLLRNFRFFWLMAGYYSKMTFEQYARSDLIRSPLTDEDWDRWKAN